LQDYLANCYSELLILGIVRCD